MQDPGIPNSELPLHAMAATTIVFFASALVAGTLGWLVLEYSRVDTVSSARLMHYGNGPTNGRWGQHTALIDWCEANYAVSPQVAEFWNTLSCVAYLVAAAPHVRRFASPDAAWKNLYAAFLAMTGITSALFHATLWWWGQKLDETFENAALVVLYHVVATASRQDGGHDRDALLTRIGLHCVLMTVLIIGVPVAFAELHLVGVLLGLFYHLLAMPRDVGDACMPFATPAAAWGLAAFAAWLLDKVACDASPTGWTQALQLHAWWHVGTAAALHGAARAVSVYKALVTGRSSSTRAQPCSEAAAGHCRFMRHAEWHDALFVHFAVDAEALQQRLPEGLLVDTHLGVAYVGVVLLTERGICPYPPGVPLWAVRWMGLSHDAVNVRTYVRPASGVGPPGIMFFTLDCSSLLPTLGALAIFNLPYRYARMYRRRAGASRAAGSRSARPPSPRPNGQPMARCWATVLTTRRR